MPSVEHAIEVATRAHKGQTRKDGMPYIVHPLRVMQAMDTPEEMIVAVLHDVIEKSDLTIEDLRKEGFSQDTLDAVSLLSKEEGVDYFDYIRMIAPHALARKVKIADVTDKSKDIQLPETTREDRDRLAHYRLAKLILLEEEQ